MTKIVSGSSCEELAQKISDYLGLDHIRARIKRFCDLEIVVEIPQNLKGEDVVIVHSTSAPAHERLVELLLMIDVVKNAGCNTVILLIPYFGYARQDKRSSLQSSFGLKVMARLLSSSGADWVLTVDPHSEKMRRFFDIKFHSIDVAQLFAQHIKRADVIVAPDKGAIKRAEKLAFFLNADLAVIEKKRTDSQVLEMHMAQGDVFGKDCVVFDDIADSGQTLRHVYDLLKTRGAKTIQAAFTHPVLSNKAAKVLLQSSFGKVFTTNTIEKEFNSSLFCVLDITASIGDFLKSINNLNVFL
jgi:ribose-phosphate pyrophosphokinase